MSVEPQGPSGVSKEQGVPERPGAQTDLARTVARRQAWIQRVLSPWVRRSLTTAPPARRGSGAASPSLTGAHTRRFVQHALDRTERAVVWQPDPGSLEPGLVQRFADAIVNQFPAVEATYEPRALASSSQDSDDLVLAGVAEHPPAEPQQREGFTPFPSLSAFVEALQAREGAAQEPSEPGAAPSGAPDGVSQRPTGVDMPHPYTVQRTSRVLPPGVRQFSRVEEVIPGQSARDTAQPDVATRSREGEPSLPPRTAAEERTGGGDRAPEPRARGAQVGGPPPAPTVQREPQGAAVKREEGPAAESAPSVEGAPPVGAESEPPVAMPLPPLGEARIEPPRPPMTGAEGALSHRVQRETSVPPDAPSVEGAPAERGALPLGPPPARPATQRQPDRGVREAGSRPPDEGRATPVPPLATPGRVETPQVRPGPEPVQRRAEAVAPAQPSEGRTSQAHPPEGWDVEPRGPGALEAPPVAHEAVRPLPTGAPSADGAPSEAEALPLPPVQRRPGVQAVRQREPVPPAEGASSERTVADVQPGTTAPPPIQWGPAVEADRERPSVSPVEAAPPAGAALPAGADRERPPPEIGAAPPLPAQRAPTPDAEPTELPLAQRRAGPTAPSVLAERPSPQESSRLVEGPRPVEAPRPGDAACRQEAEPEAEPFETAVPPQPAGPTVAQRRTEAEAPGRAAPRPSVEGRRVAEATIPPAAEAEPPSAAQMPPGPTAPPVAQRQPVGDARPARGEPSVEAPEGRLPVMPLVRPPDVGPHVEQAGLQAVPESSAVEPGPTGVERPAAPRADIPVQRRPARPEEDIRAGPEVETRTEAPERAEPRSLRPPPGPAPVQRRVAHAEETTPAAEEVRAAAPAVAPMPRATAPEGEIRLRADQGMAILPQARRIQPARERAEAVGVEPHARGRYPSRAVDEGPSPPLYRAPLPAVQRARPADRGLDAPAPKEAVAAPALTPIGELPLSLPIPPAPAVQRQPVDGASAVSLAEGELTVQRVEMLPAESQETREEEGPDLNRLAREVYPYIVRMLAVERERRAGRRGR